MFAFAESFLLDGGSRFDHVQPNTAENCRANLPTRMVIIVRAANRDVRTCCCRSRASTKDRAVLFLKAGTLSNNVAKRSRQTAHAH